MDSDRQVTRVAQFIRKAFHTPPGDGDLYKLNLIHLGTKNTELWQHDIEQGFTNDDVDPVAAQIVDCAHDDAEGLGGIQKYKVQAFFGTKKRAGRVSRFAVDARDETEDSEFSEPANTKGLVAQLMRHNEAIMKTSVMSVQKMMGMLVQQLALKDEQLAQWETKHFDMIELREKLLSENEERELTKLQTIASETRKDEMLKTAKTLLPMVAGRAGQKLLPPGSIKEEELLKQKLKSLGDSLTPEQVARLSESLDTAQAIAFVDILKSIKQGEES